MELMDSRKTLGKTKNVAIAELESLGTFTRVSATHVIRRPDLYGLFATEPDLGGGFTDVSPYVRDASPESSVYVFWRSSPTESEAAPGREEICAVPVGELRAFLGSLGFTREWNAETNRWEHRRAPAIRPGMTLLLDLRQGGYDEQLGWTANPKDKPQWTAQATVAPDSENQDLRSRSDWLALSAHLREAEAEAVSMVSSLGLAETPEGTAVIRAALWHDVGKAHPRWQDAVRDFARRYDLDIPSTGPWAKFPEVRNASFRPGMRHEAATALLAWQLWQQGVGKWDALSVFLILAHHGKARTILRNRSKRDVDVFGVNSGDSIPALPGWIDTDTPLDLSCRGFASSGIWSMDGDSFVQSGPSWVSMVAELLGPELPGDPIPTEAVPATEPRGLGPFRLACLEALTAAANWRASNSWKQGAR